MEMSLVHLSAEMRVMQTALQMESDSVELKENCLGQRTEIQMATNSGLLLAVLTEILMVLMMGSKWVYLMEICLAQLKVTPKVMSLVRL